jgi:predicted TIM-barrel fold metal-dependent hydrolase
MRFKIDSDSHYIDPEIFKYVSEENRSKVPTFDFDHEGRLIKVNFNIDPLPITFNPLEPHGDNKYAGISNLQSRINDFKSLGINFQILNPQENALRFSYLVEKNLAVDMAQSYNRRMLEIVNQYPDKFLAPALLALQDPEWSLTEIQWAKNNGFTSVIVDTDWPDQTYISGWPLVAAPRFEDICVECERLGLLLNIHHSMHQLGFDKIPQFFNYGLHHLMPSKHMMALIGLITSGILLRHPNLKVLLSEGQMKYIGRSYDILVRMKIPNIDQYFKENFWFTIETEDTENLLSLIKKFGADRFLFATDYPHDDPGGAMQWKDQHLIEQLPISEEEKDLICFKNSANIFQIKI